MLVLIQMIRNISYDTGCGTTIHYTHISQKKQDIIKLAPTSVEELSTAGPNVFVSLETSEVSKNKDKCIFNDRNQP